MTKIYYKIETGQTSDYNIWSVSQTLKGVAADLIKLQKFRPAHYPENITVSVGKKDKQTKQIIRTKFYKFANGKLTLAGQYAEGFFNG